MTNSEYASNQKTSFQSVFKDKINYYPQKLESNPPSYFVPPPINNINFSSNISTKGFPYRERINSFCSKKNDNDDEINKNLFFPTPIPIKNPSFFEFQFPNISRGQSGFLSKMPTFGDSFGKSTKLEPKKYFFDYFPEFENDNKEYPKKDILFKHKFEAKNNNQNNQIILKNNIIIKDNNNLDFNENCKIDKNMNLNLNSTTNNNMGTKFFTNHNYGYKCSCSKTQCNRKYCECYNSGNYCIDCNCKNCKNQPPQNTYSNKRPSDLVSKMKKSKEICTCTKSGCNKNYCECFKSGNKCTSLCRCIDCENTDDNNKLRNKNIFNYECCPANSIYITKNKCIIENIKNLNEEERDILKYDNYEVKNDKMICKKRKRDEGEISEDNNNIKKNKKNKNEDNILFNDSLFDKNGKVILRHINMIHY